MDLQVEPNARKIEEHRRKYQRLRKEKEQKKAERGRQRQRTAEVRWQYILFSIWDFIFT